MDDPEPPLFRRGKAEKEVKFFVGHVFKRRDGEGAMVLAGWQWAEVGERSPSLVPIRRC